MNELILVEDNDNIIGYGEKMPVHINGDLHRAFSVFIWDKNSKKLLIQKRALEKYHSGGKWSNSCCSHPYKDETLEESVKRCIMSEYGTAIDVSERIKILGKFKYKSDYNGIFEHEIDNVIILYAHQSEFPENQFVSAEIERLKWFTIEELNDFLSENRMLFSSWFENAYQIFLTEESVMAYERLKDLLSAIHYNNMWFNKALLEQYTEMIDKREIGAEVLTFSESDFQNYIFDKSKEKIEQFKRYMKQVQNQADYYRIKEKLYPVNSMSDIIIQCKYNYQHLVGRYKIYIYPYYNNNFLNGVHESSSSYIIEAQNNSLVIPYCFKSEDMYIINIFYCFNDEELPFISEKVYALKKDLFELKIFKADLHIHTTYSDGIESPEFTVISAIEKGMDVIAITDHNNFNGSIAAQKFVKEKNIPLTVLTGEEYSLDFSPMHIIALGTDKPIDRKYIGSNVAETPEAISMLSEINMEKMNCDSKAYVYTQVLLDKIKESGGISFLAHPLWKPINSRGERIDTPETLFIELGKDRRFSGIEVVSGSPDGCYSVSNLQMSLACEILGNVENIAIIGTTDSHNYSTDKITGKHYTIIFSKSGNEKDIIDSLRVGRCVAVEMIGDEPTCYGNYRYVKFAHFLTRYYFKEHDEKAMIEGKNLKKKYFSVNNEVVK